MVIIVIVPEGCAARTDIFIDFVVRGGHMFRSPGLQLFNNSMEAHRGIFGTICLVLRYFVQNKGSPYNQAARPYKALKGLMGPLRALYGPYERSKALEGLIWPTPMHFDQACSLSLL